MNSLLKLAAAGLLAALSGASAHATVVSFTGDGQFSNISNCGSGSPGCSISNGGNWLDMSGDNNSWLKITDISGSVSADANDVVIGKITWTNNASTHTDQNFNVKYTFTLSFTSPNVQSDAQVFMLNIQQPTNPPGDSVFQISNSTLANLGPYSLLGVTISDIRFSEVGSGFYNGTIWQNPEYSVSKLYITADFAFADPVPEPSTWAMMLLGFAGLGFIAHRRRTRAAAA